MTKTERVWLFAASVAVLFLVGKAIWDRLPQPQLSDALISADAALAKDDASTLMKFIDPLERKALEMDREKLQRLLEWRRKLVGKESVTSKPTLITDDSDHVAALDTYHDASGKELYVGLGAYRAEDGPRLNLVGDLVVFSLYHAYAPRFPALGKVDRKWPAVAYGLGIHRKELEAMGFAGYFSGPPDFKFVSWTDLQQFSERRMMPKQSTGG